MLGAWAVTSLLTGGSLYLLRQLFALDWTHDRQRMLAETAQRLALPTPRSGLGVLDFTSPAGHAVRAHATPHLELRMPLVGWLPRNLVVDTIAPPMRGLRQLVPDPRFLEWVAAGDPGELLGVLSPAVRDALLEAHHYGPGPGICIRRGGLEVALPWRDLDLLDTTLERMDRIASALEAQPRALPARLRASVQSEDRFEVRQASLRALQSRFPHHPDTRAARAFAEANSLVPRLLSAPERDAQRGELALAPRQDGKLSVAGRCASANSRPRSASIARP